MVIREDQRNLTVPEEQSAQSAVILLCFLTDRENTPQSKRIGILSTGRLPVMKFIARGIRNGRITYRSPLDDTDEVSPEDQYCNFIFDWNDTPGDELLFTFNPRLKGCVLDTALNGKVYAPVQTRRF